MKFQIKSLDELKWDPHPFLKGVEFKYLLTKAQDQLDITFSFVRVAPGTDVAAHVHETQDDIIYMVEGSMKMWVEGEGDFAVKAGQMIRVLKGVKHKPYGHSPDFLCIDIFLPAMV
jgi:quercetin dioxygenase-like cupin family protein